jgi:hypothetical protein
MAHSTTQYSGMPTNLMQANAPATGGAAPVTPPIPSAPPQYASSPVRLMAHGMSGGAGGGDAPSAASPFLINRQDLIKNYANMVARTWSDPSFLQLLQSNPVSVLAQAGLPTIPGAVVRVIEMKLTGLGSIDEQVDNWVKGIQTGLYDLLIPIKPEGIQVPPPGGGDVNCCCTPCCCCT